MNIALIGSTGLLGTALKEMFLSESVVLVSPSSKEVNLLDPKTFDRLLDTNVDVVVNAAGFTQVDLCETESKTAMNLNAFAPTHLAKWCKVHQKKLIHFSTDYVFDGSGVIPWKETDLPRPLSVYGVSKLKGEEGIREGLANHLILRIQWVYGKNGKNFVTTMCDLAQKQTVLQVVHDQVGSLSLNTDLAQAVLSSIHKDLQGTYHIANEGVASWYDVAVELKRLGRVQSEVVPVDSKTFVRPAVRPKNSRLNVEKWVHATGRTLPHWKEALKNFFEKT